MEQDDFALSKDCGHSDSNVRKSGPHRYPPACWRYSSARGLLQTLCVTALKIAPRAITPVLRRRPAVSRPCKLARRQKAAIDRNGGVLQGARKDSDATSGFRKPRADELQARQP